MQVTYNNEKLKTYKSKVIQKSYIKIMTDSITTHSKRFTTLICGLIMAFVSHLHAAELPDLGSPDLVEYDTTTEERLGWAFTSALHTHYDLNSDPDINTYIRKIGHEIASQTGDRTPFKFYVINNPSINAFAGPNGIIGIHTGLVLAVKDEAELAAVIAHEIAHVTQKHLSRRHEFQSSQSNLTTIATLLAAVLIGIHEPSAVMPTLLGGMGFNIEQQLKNSRLHESEADHAGIKLLYQAGYNPHAMGDFFSRLSKESQYNEFQVPEILRSHPVTDRRISGAENRAQVMPTIQSKKVDNHLSLIQLKLQNATQQPLTHYQTTPLSFDERCYQKNLQALSSPTINSAPNSLQCLIKNIKQEPKHPLYTTLLVKLIIKHNLTPSELIHLALNQSDLLLAIYPDNTAILLNYVELLLYLNQELKAIELLNSKADSKRYKRPAYQKLSEIHATKNNQAEAYYFLARSEYEIGNFKRANYLLQQAESNLSNAQTALKHKIEVFSRQNNKLLKYKEISNF